MLKQSYFLIMILILTNNSQSSSWNITWMGNDQSGRRGHSNKLFKRRSRLDIRKFALSNRI